MQWYLKLLPGVMLVIGVGCVDNFLRGQSILYGLSSLTETLSRNTTCSDQLNALYKDIDLKRFWALKVMDASGQPDVGFLWGNNLWVGSHFLCSEASNRKPLELNYKRINRSDATPFDYPPYPMVFTMFFMKHNSTHQPYLQMTLKNLIELGLCVPKTCDIEELQFYMQSYLDSHYLHFQNLYSLNIKIENVKVLGEGDSLLSNPKNIFTLTVLLISIGLVAAGTIYDIKIYQKKYIKKGETLKQLNSTSTSASTISSIYERKDPSKFDYQQQQRPNKDEGNDAFPERESAAGKIIRCFSIYTNTKTLVNTEIPSDSIGAIHGVRFLSMLWVIGVHSLFYQVDYMKSVATGFRLSENFLQQILGNATYVVDSFFCMSGFLLSYGYFKSKSGKLKEMNWKLKVSDVLTMFANRILRLTPVYIMAILLSQLIFAYYRQTSALYWSEQPDINCAKYWWRNLLYINNLYPRSEMCFSWSYYIAADTQFFLISSILVTISTTAGKTFITLLVTIVLVCMVATGYKSYSIGYIPTMDDQFSQLDAIYDLPWNRIGPYLIGVFVGYILVIRLQGKLQLKKRYLLLCWIVFPAINLWVLFTLYGRQISVEFSAIYMGVSRTLWGFGIGWLFVACATGNAGAVNKFLAFRGWIPLSRVTYCSYLINPILISAIYLGTETAQNSSLADYTVAVCGQCLLTFVISYVAFVIFEAPYILLTKMLHAKLTQKKKKKPEENPA